ncbi:MAG TPA: YaeQ family protein [Moraxellaceae bacterium]|nr:YaeQ family protein [Moraxellaceae bacterium]
MAQNATIFKAELSVSDLDRHYYGSHALTLARHPSETDERLMVRLLAFVLNASEHLAFGKGLSADDEPDLWEKDLTGAVVKWIEVGQPDEKRLRKACGVAREVLVYPYGGNAAAVWWEQNRRAIARLEKVRVVNIPGDTSAALGALAQRTMQLQATVQDGEVWLSDANGSLQVVPEAWQAPA